VRRAKQVSEAVVAVAQALLVQAKMAALDLIVL
jgi:hypothetical protein